MLELNYPRPKGLCLCLPFPLMKTAEPFFRFVPSVGFGKFCLVFLLIFFSWFAYAQENILVLDYPLSDTQIRDYIQNPSQGYSYFVVAPHAFLEPCLPLARFRQRAGHSVVCITVEAVMANFPGKPEEAIRDFVSHAQEKWPEPKPRFLLLVGDTFPSSPDIPGIPTFFVPDYKGVAMATDYPYGGNWESHPVVVGRFPARTREDVKHMVEKTLAYEEKRKGGMWQKRVSFVAGEGGFGKAADTLLEDIFKKLLSSYLPCWCDVHVAYGNPNSSYFFPADLFPTLVASEINKGSLFFVYVGHGSKNSFGHIRFQEKLFDIFPQSQVEKIEVSEGMPILVSIACYTGKWEEKEDCLGEALVKSSQGPVAFIGASQVSHPYGNVLFGKAFLQAVFTKKMATIGEALEFVQGQLLQPPRWSLNQAFLDIAAKIFAGSDLPLKQLKKDHVYMYNLLGDPALRMAFPESSLSFQVKYQPDKEEEVLYITGEVPAEMSDYEIIARLEVPLERMIEESFFSDRDFIPQDSPWRKRKDWKVIARHFYSNHKVLCSSQCHGKESKFTIVLKQKQKWPEGIYWVKLFVMGKTQSMVGCQIWKK